MVRSDINAPGRDRERLASALNIAASGEASGLRIVYQLTSANLFGICLRICGDRQAAEDVLQEVYVKVWRRASSFDAERASPISWLAMIAHNAAIDWRRAHHRIDMSGDDDCLRAIADEAPLADAVAEQDEESRRLFACLDELDISQSSSIRRAFLDGMTYQQVSNETGTPLGTIKSWIRRGMQKLKDCLGDG